MIIKHMVFEVENKSHENRPDSIDQEDTPFIFQF